MLLEITRSVHEMSEGELIQTEQSENLRMTRELYLDIIYKKTASLLAACSAIGAISVKAPEEQIVFEKNDYFIKEDPELKNEIQWIIPNAQKNTMEPIRLTLGVGGSTYPDSPHEGEEFGYVLSGSILIHLGNRTYKAKKGESFYYTSDKTHYLESRSGATILWVSSPPSF